MFYSMLYSRVLMRVIIAGAGEVGRGVAAALRDESRSVALIDPDPKSINESQSLDCLLITGDGLSRESLNRAGISDAEIIVFATNDDHINLLGCSFAKRVYSEQVGDRAASGLIAIALIRNSKITDYSSGAGPLEKWTRANHIVCPSEEIVEQLVSGIIAPSLNDVLPLGDNSWITVSDVSKDSILIGKTTGEDINIEDKAIMSKIYAMKDSEGKEIISKGDELIQEGDLLLFVTNSTQSFSDISQSLGKVEFEMPTSPSVVIVGATSFGSKLAEYYLSKGSNVVIIEPNLDSANEIVGSQIGINKRLDVIHGDPQDEELLKELDIDDFDIAISTLEDDNLNISISMRAMDKGVNRTGLLLKDRALVEAVHRIGLTRPVSKRRVAITSILKSIHMHVPGTYQRIPSMPSLVSISAVISSNNGHISKSITEIENELRVRVVMIERQSKEGTLETIIPSPSNIIEANDRVYLILNINDIKKVENSLES